MDVAKKKKQKADYEREAYQNDVRYQNRTEITLDCGLAKRDQGLFSRLDTAVSRKTDGVIFLSCESAVPFLLCHNQGNTTSTLDKIPSFFRV